MSTPSNTIAASVTTSPTATCVTAVPGKYGYVPPAACNSLYNYNPSLAAAAIFTVIFGIATGAHLVQAISYRKKFCWVIIMGAIWETCSFILRALGTRNQQNVSYVTVSQILLLLAPLWINAFDYMILGRMVYYFLPEKNLLHMHASRFSLCFVMLDILSFLVQATGGIMLSGTNVPPHLMKIGKDVYMCGIGLQQLFILVFLALAIMFHRRVLVLEQLGVLEASGKTHWRRLLYTLYVSLTLITIRIIFRLVEFSHGTGTNNPISDHEAYMYCLDALPMAAALYVMSFSHPARTLVGPDSEFRKLTHAQKKEAKEAKKRARQETKAANELGQSSFLDVELGERRDEERGRVQETGLP